MTLRGGESLIEVVLADDDPALGADLDVHGRDASGQTGVALHLVQVSRLDRDLCLARLLHLPQHDVLAHVVGPSPSRTTPTIQSPAAPLRYGPLLLLPRFHRLMIRRLRSFAGSPRTKCLT